MLPLFITNALEDKSPPVYGDGLNVRDWIHVEDHVRDRPGHVRRHAVSAGKLKAATGGSPRWTLERGLPETVRWYESHTDRWQRIKEGEYREYYEKMYASR